MDKIHSKCQDLHIIANFIEDWRKLVWHFGLTKPEVAAISEDCSNTHDKKMRFLHTWTKHNGDNATYQQLFMRCLEAGEVELVDEICKGMTYNYVHKDIINSDISCMPTYSISNTFSNQILGCMGWYV